ncbi:MAG: SH3 domain-containing protein [Oscillospiraceae bacterium]|nr:SH3 domain-containing protein [Oscillospiraceae bacterium]
MKKRFLCAFLTLIMLVSLVPAAALTVSAAGRSTSENAITVLKQWNGYKSTCGADGYVGYGTLCEVKATHGVPGHAHNVNEKQADTALRAKLAELDKVINSFASNAGISLSQGQHDALVLFSFDNGTAWTTGTGSFRSAVVSGLKGNDFLNAICWWNNSTADDARRKVEANMYLNGAYDSVAPSRFITIEYIPGYISGEGEKIPVSEFTADEISYYTGEGMVHGGYVVFPGISYEGHLAQAQYRYYDTATNPVVDVIPTMDNHKFMGWYSDPFAHNGGHQVTDLKYSRTLYAYWQSYDAEPDNGAPETGIVHYIREFSEQTALYDTPGGNKLDYTVKGNLTIDSEFIDETGMRWGRVYKAQKLYHKGTKVEEAAEMPVLVALGLESVYQHVWVKLGQTSFYNGMGNAPTTKNDIDVTVTVTNDYVRVRAEDSIYSKELRRARMGEKLRIVNTSSGDGFLWGQIADGNNKRIGWVALMYTNWESVKTQNTVTNTQKVVGNATIVKPVNGYVNLRSGAGTANQIVGALPYKSRVAIYEITYVNGIRWGRTDSGWFSLAYAEVDGIDEDDYTSNANVLAYAFVGDVNNTWNIHEKPSDDATLVRTKPDFNPYDRTFTHLTADDYGNTWGKIAEGWVKLSYADSTAADAVLKMARYKVISDTVTIRSTPSHAANRVDTLVKNVEFCVNINYHQIMVIGDDVWAYAYKIGETHEEYNGWICLSSASVSRVDAPAAEKNNDSSHNTGKQATIINTDNVNVRAYTSASYKKMGSLSRGAVVAIWEEKDGWYKVDSNRNGKYDYDHDGWVSGHYLEIVDAPTGTNGSGNGTGSNAGSGVVETGLGIVANTYTGVNVRTGAGTGYAPNGKILAGSTVEILEVKTVGAAKWGRVTQGWICLDYVTMVSKYPIAGSNNSNGNAANGGTSSSTTTTASQTVIYTGTIIRDNVKVCVEPSVEIHALDFNNTEKVRIVPAGTPVTIHELLAVEETVVEHSAGDITTTVTKTYYWARTNDGYILNPGDCVELDPFGEKTYTVTSYVNTVDNELKVFTAPGGSLTGSTLNKYDQVSVTTLKIYRNELWCRVEYMDDDSVLQEGYVQIKYLTAGAVADPATTNNNNNNSNNNNNTGNQGGNGLTMGSTGNTGNQGANGYVSNSAGYRYKGNIIRTGTVNVRATPSQNGTLTTTMKSGAALVIYETVVSESMAWGRCDAGWVYLYYVDLQPCNTAVDAKVVYNENTIAYTDANCSGVAGTYSRMSVVDIYEVVGNMCRTDLGWVHMDNLG